jgi:hypothetical protein
MIATPESLQCDSQCILLPLALRGAQNRHGAPAAARGVRYAVERCALGVVATLDRPAHAQ